MLKKLKSIKQTNKNYIGIILAIEILLILFCVLFYGSFGLTGDYYSQHSTLPRMFRQLFYETGRLIPDNAWQLGGGQNIFNFSYYGLLSPIVLVTYLFPWVDMLVCMQIVCAFLYCSIGVLTYIWLKNHFTKNEALCGGLMMAFANPVLYNLQNQIVFVECLPFLILTLIAVDRKMKTGKNTFFIFASFLMIMVNYYSSIVCLCCVGIYYLYLYFKDNSKLTIKALWSIIRPMFVSILMAGILLIPTAYAIMGSERMHSEDYSWWQILLVPDFRDLYNPTEMGLNYIFIFAFIAVICSSKKKISEKLLSITIFGLTFVPFVLYALNGGNYIRNKISIPLWPLWVLLVLIMYRKAKNKELNYKKIGIIFTILTVLIVGYASIAINVLRDNHYYIFTSIIAEFIAIAIVFAIAKKKEKYGLIMAFTVIMMGIVSFTLENGTDHFETFTYESVSDEAVASIDKNDKDTYRIDNSVKYTIDMNRVFNDNYYTNSVYTSTSNKYYMNFVRNDMGNGVYYRNYLMLWGCHNPLFSTYMGNKYALSNYDIESKMYQKVDQKGEVNIYKNENAFPLIYGRQGGVSKKEFDKLGFPYTADCLLNNVVVDDGKEKYTNTGLEEYGKGYFKTDYHIEHDTIYTFSKLLPEPIKDKYLIIQFDVKQMEDQDLIILINEYKNALTAKTSHWDNGNTTFTYVLPAKDEMTFLNMTIKPGIYDISNLKLYTYDFDDSKIDIDRGKNIKIDKKKSEVTTSLTAKEDEYLVTSFPYDEGYKVFVDGKETEKLNLNDGFVGCRIKKGHHDVKIEYHTPWRNIGLAVTCLGLLWFVVEFILDRRRKQK